MQIRRTLYLREVERQLRKQGHAKSFATAAANRMSTEELIASLPIAARIRVFMKAVSDALQKPKNERNILDVTDGGLREVGEIGATTSRDLPGRARGGRGRVSTANPERKRAPTIVSKRNTP